MRKEEEWRIEFPYLARTAKRTLLAGGVLCLTSLVFLSILTCALVPSGVLFAEWSRFRFFKRGK